MAVTDALAVMVNVQVNVLAPPLEQAPDHMTGRLLVALSVIDVLPGKDAVPVLPTVTLIPAGVELTVSPACPVAVTVRVAAATGVTVSAAVRVTAPSLAVIVADVDVVTAVVVTGKVAINAPAGTVTFAGTETAVLLLDSATAHPPAGAAVVRRTVPCEAVPPVTVVGLTDTVESDVDGVADVTVSVALAVAPSYVALMVAGVDAVTLVVLIEKVPLVDPAGTVTLAGTVAAAALLARVTTASPIGAAEVSVTVPTEAVPPITLAGLKETALAAGAGAVGVTALDAAEAGPVPTALVAKTWSVTAVPLVRPVTVAVVTLPATVTVPTSRPAFSALTV